MIEAADIEELRRKFADPPAECRPMVRWWWFGPAVTAEEIERELREMKSQGIGGVELQPVYPLSLDDPDNGIRNVRYLSEEFRALMLHAVRTAKELGLVFDATFGSGWPFGGPHITIELASKKLRCVRLDVSDRDTVRLEPPVSLEDHECVLMINACPIRRDGSVDLTGCIRVDANKEYWQAPRGHWRVMWFLEGHTRQEVKRPAVGAEGLVMDHYDRRAFAAHAAVVGDAYEAVADQAGEGSIRAMFCDSWEVHDCNWASGLLEEFRKRRGYDLLDYLPALWNDAGEVTPFVRWDYRRTLSEMALEEFFSPFARWCEERGFAARMQAHGTPGDLIESYGTAHIPEGESYGAQLRFQPEPEADIPTPSGLYHRAFAASTAAIFGRRLCSSESYTWLRNPRFLESLEDIKAATDVQLAQGVNNIVCHGYPYSPPQVGAPGWVFYAGSVMNHNNTWWPYFRRVADYVGRACMLLRQGESASRVCLYAPTNDAWAESGQPPRSSGAETIRRFPDSLAHSLRLAGYQYDLVNDESLVSRASITDGQLAIGDAKYDAIVVAGAERMQPKAMARIAEFASAKGAVLFVDRLPDSSCSLLNRAAETAEVRELTSEALANGAILTDANQVAAEMLARVPPNVTIEPADADIGFRHRKRGETDIYFLANVSPRDKRITFSVQGGRRSAHVWDAMTGEVFSLRQSDSDKAGFSTVLGLEPFQSLFLVLFENESGLADLPQWRTSEPRILEAIDLQSGWTLQAPEDAREIELDKLESWTQWPELVHYSGRGRYRIEFDIQPDALASNCDMWLDLGDVREIAEVIVNGAPAGITWKRPHRLPVGHLLKPGTNTLEVIVTNLLINRVLGEPDPDYTALENTYGKRFPDPQEKAKASPVPSGLLGPVRIVRSEEDA